MKKTRLDFDMIIGVSDATLGNCDQVCLSPKGPFRALLKIAVEIPVVVVEALEVL